MWPQALCFLPAPLWRCCHIQVQILLNMVASSLSPRYWAISAVHCLRGGGIEGRLFVLGEFLKVTHTIGAHSNYPMAGKFIWNLENNSR